MLGPAFIQSGTSVRLAYGTAHHGCSDTPTACRCPPRLRQSAASPGVWAVNVVVLIS